MRAARATQGWLRWENNGTIVQKIDPSFRVMVMEADFMEDLFSRIERTLGISVRHIVFEAQRSAAKSYIDNWLRGPLGKLLLIPGAKRFVVNQFNKLAILLGMVYSETDGIQIRKVWYCQDAESLFA